MGAASESPSVKITLKILSAIAVAGFLGMLGYLIMRSEPARREATFFPMGGIPFKVVAYGRNEEEFAGDMAAVEQRVASLEERFNRFKSASELAAVNREAASGPVAISDDMRRIIALSREWHTASDGAFDPSITPLIVLWKDAEGEGSLPDAERLAETKGMVGLEMVEVADDEVSFAREGMSLDFGAIAKGLILDEVANLLMRRRVARGVIDAGGNALAFGVGKFRFGIQDPMEERGRLMGAIDVSMGGVVTSGSYERYVTIGGKRYSHIIDPRTGTPVENGMIAATVVGGTGAGADALATTLMILGRDEGIALIKRLGNYEALMIEEGDDGPVAWISTGLASRLMLTKNWSDRVRLF